MEDREIVTLYILKLLIEKQWVPMYIERNATECALLCQACNLYFYSQVKKLLSKVWELPSPYGSCSWTRSKRDYIKCIHVTNYKPLFTVTFSCVHCVPMDFCDVFSSVKKAYRWLCQLCTDMKQIDHSLELTCLIL
jgi:hypothetical protein